MSDEKRSSPSDAKAFGLDLPVMRAPDGGWVMELTAGAEGSLKVHYERAGGIVRLTGEAVVRHATGGARHPITIVLREEDAKGLGSSLLGRLNALF